MVLGGVVPVVNLPGVAPGQLKFSGPVLADIFLGKITKWNDPAIAKLNPGMTLPATDITVVHRSDGSGTTYIWADYLCQGQPGMEDARSARTRPSNWPTGVGGKGNEGVAGYVKQIPGAIGYVEYAYALQNKMSLRARAEQGGTLRQPNGKSFSAAAATVDWSQAKDFYLLMTNAPGANAWPIAATTWVVMYRKPKNPSATAR